MNDSPSASQQAHRHIRELIGEIRAVSQRTLSSAPSLEMAAMQLDARLAALARALASLAVDDGTADLEFLIGEELRAGGIRESEATIQGGPTILLQNRAARALTLGLSELATATAANDRGEDCSLRITWSVAVEEGARWLKVRWHHEQKAQAGQVRSRRLPMEPDHWTGLFEVSNDEEAGIYLISVPLD